MPRKSGMREDDVTARLADLERRMDAMEGVAHQPDPKPRKAPKDGE